MLDDQISEFFENIKSKVEQISGNVPLLELLNSTFMRIHTRFANFEEMVASPFGIKTVEDLRNCFGPQWDAYVAKQTTFSSWQEMLNRAAAERIRRQLKRG